MNKIEFIEKVNALEFDPSGYIVVGSGILCALEIRQADDVDVVVTEDLFKKLGNNPKYQKKYFDDGSYYLTHELYEIGPSWDSRDDKPNFDELKKSEQIIDGIPFVSLERLRSWKFEQGRPKDVQDIALIDAYLTR